MYYFLEFYRVFYLSDSTPPPPIMYIARKLVTYLTLVEFIIIFFFS